MADLERIYELILDQYSDCPNWQKYYKVFCEMTDELLEAIVKFMTQRYLTTAEGHWLDVCGTILGLPRPQEWVTEGLFTWDSDVPGERWDEGLWSTPNGLRTSDLMEDPEYRRLLQAKAFCSNANGSLWAIARTIDIGFDIEYTIETVSPRTIHITFDDPGSVTQRDRYYIKLLAPVSGGMTLAFAN